MALSPEMQAEMLMGRPLCRLHAHFIEEKKDFTHPNGCFLGEIYLTTASGLTLQAAMPSEGFCTYDEIYTHLDSRGNYLHTPYFLLVDQEGNRIVQMEKERHWDFDGRIDIEAIPVCTHTIATNQSDFPLSRDAHMPDVLLWGICVMLLSLLWGLIWWQIWRRRRAG